MKYIFAFILLSLFTACQKLGDVVVKNDTSVFYKEVGLKSIALRTVDYLDKNKFTNGTINTMQITRDSIYNVRIAMSKTLATDRQLQTNFQVLGTSMSEEVFNGADINFQLCDYRFNTIRTIPIKHSNL